MKLFSILKSIIKFSFILLMVDLVYLTLMTGHFKKLVKDIQKSELNLKLVPTFFVYVSIVMSWYLFVERNSKQKVQDSFMLGVLMYGMYDLTNYAIFKNWDIKTVVIDTLWGGTLYSLSTYIYTTI
jgi:uncharacterized membrane protein